MPIVSSLFRGYISWSVSVECFPYLESSAAIQLAYVERVLIMLTPAYLKTATIQDLQLKLEDGSFTSEELVRGYLCQCLRVSEGSVRKWMPTSIANPTGLHIHSTDRQEQLARSKITCGH